ncbi:MAG: PIG-L family deacetylase [Armatimonadetes bacterium]|nr:PIG-L family deacetylase [Armatimonadota bacterium]
MQVDVLTVGAHMGDEVAWGMALAAHKRQGASIGMLHLTPGEKGHPSLHPDEYALQKREEAAACASMLRAEMWALGYKDGELPCNDEVKFAVADVLREARPSVVITRWHGSMHKDHTNTARLFPDVLFYSALATFERALPAHSVQSLYFGENWEDLYGYVPEALLEVTSEDMALWEKAMRCYALFRGEWETFEYLDYYKALARTRGCENRSQHAVSFAVAPESRRRRMKSLL